MFCERSPFLSGPSCKHVVSFSQKETLSTNTDWTTLRACNATLQRIDQGGNLLLNNKEETWQSIQKHQQYTPETTPMAESLERELKRNISFYQRWSISHEKKSSTKLAGISVNWEKAQWAKKMVTADKNWPKIEFKFQISPNGSFAPAIQ